MSNFRSEFHVSVDEGVAFLRVEGEVDLAWAKELRQAGEGALTNDVGTLRIDLSAVTFLDSTGVGALVAIRNRGLETRSVVVIDDPSPQCRRVLEVTGLLKFFKVDEVEPTALPTAI